MRFLRFVLRGKRAHFRRFYSNSSALTYPVPPPSALLGLLGAALGLEPGELPRLAGLRLSVRPLGEVRTLFQTVNHLFIKANPLAEARGLAKEGRTQIPLQFLVGERGVGFEVWAVGEEGLVEGLARAVLEPAYPLSLGPAYALAWVPAEEVRTGEARLQKGFTGPLLGLLEVEKLALGPLPSGGRVFRDRFPVRLGPDRRPLRVAELCLEAGGLPLEGDYQGEVLLWEEAGVALVEV